MTLWNKVDLAPVVSNAYLLAMKTEKEGKTCITLGVFDKSVGRWQKSPMCEPSLIIHWMEIPRVPAD